MKALIDIEDELLKQVGAVAAQRGVSLKAMVERALRREIMDQDYPNEGGCGFTIDEDGLPILARRGGKPVSPEDIDRLMEEDY